MRINQLTLRNFMGYASAPNLDFNSKFILLVGANGAGKTSLLEAMADALGIWHASVYGYGWRNIADSHIRRAWVGANGAKTLEKQFPVEISVSGEIAGHKLDWAVGLTKGNKTSRKNAKAARQVIEQLAEQARAGQPVVLPLVAYYGDGRLHLDRQVRASRGGKENSKRIQNRLSRFEGNRNSLDSRIAWKDLLQWVARQEWIAFQEKQEPVEYQVFKQAILDCLDGGESFGYDARAEQILVGIRQQGVLPLEHLSSGQISMVVMVGDLVRRLVLLNPHLGRDAAKLSPGIVLIDELDLHLHPVWQRRIAADLKRTFPNLQFICTSHSPQVIGEVRPEEIRRLDTQGGISTPERSFGIDSSRVLEELMAAPPRNEAVELKLRKLFRLIDQEQFDAARKVLPGVEAQLGPDDPEVTRARTLMAFLESAA